MAEEGTTANTGERREKENTVKDVTGRERIIALAVTEEYIDDEGSIAIYRHLLTAGS